jgi:hypothetical protein
MEQMDQLKQELVEAQTPSGVALIEQKMKVLKDLEK